MSVWSTRAFPQYGTYSIRINYGAGLRVLAQMILLRLCGGMRACARRVYSRGGLLVYELIHKVPTWDENKRCRIMYKKLCLHVSL